MTDSAEKKRQEAITVAILAFAAFYPMMASILTILWYRMSWHDRWNEWHQSPLPFYIALIPPVVSLFWLPLKPAWVRAPVMGGYFLFMVPLLVTVFGFSTCPFSSLGIRLPGCAPHMKPVKLGPIDPILPFDQPADPLPETWTPPPDPTPKIVSQSNSGEQGFYLYMLSPTSIEHHGAQALVKASGTGIFKNRTLTTSADQWTIDLNITFANADAPDTRACLDKIQQFVDDNAPVSDQQLSVFGKGSYKLWGGGMPIWKADMKLNKLTMCDWTPRLDQPFIQPSAFPMGYDPGMGESPTAPTMPEPPNPGYKKDPLAPKLRYLSGKPVPPLLPPAGQ